MLELRGSFRKFLGDLGLKPRYISGSLAPVGGNEGVVPDARTPGQGGQLLYLVSRIH